MKTRTTKWSFLVIARIMAYPVITWIALFALFDSDRAGWILLCAACVTSIYAWAAHAMSAAQELRIDESGIRRLNDDLRIPWTEVTAVTHRRALVGSTIEFHYSGGALHCVLKDTDFSSGVYKTVEDVKGKNAIIVDPMARLSHRWAAQRAILGGLGTWLNLSLAVLYFQVVYLIMEGSSPGQTLLRHSHGRAVAGVGYVALILLYAIPWHGYNWKTAIVSQVVGTAAWFVILEVRLASGANVYQPYPFSMTIIGSVAFATVLFLIQSAPAIISRLRPVLRKNSVRR